MKRRVLLVCNPVAGPSRNRGARVAALREGLRKAGHRVEERVTGGPGDAERVVEAEAGGWEVVVSVGGDGTANEVVNGLIRGGHANTAFAVAPLGTGNDLAQLLVSTVRPVVEGFLFGRPFRHRQDLPDHGLLYLWQPLVGLRSLI